MLTGTRKVGNQECVHMVDNQDLVICSDMLTYVSLAQGQTLRDEIDKSSIRDLITIYRNRDKNHHHYSLEQYFYCVFIKSTTKLEKTTLTPREQTLTLISTAS